MGYPWSHGDKLIASDLNAAILNVSSPGVAVAANVTAYGATGDGVTDDTAAINAAIASLGSTGGIVIFRPGVYVTSSTITVAANGVHLVGSGCSGLNVGTRLKSTSTTTNLLTFTGANCGLTDIGLTFATTPSAGFAISSTGANNVFSRFIITNCWDGIEITTGSAQFVSQFQILTYANRGIYIHAVNDIYFDTFILNAGNVTNGAGGGIKLQDKAEAVTVSNGDILLGVNSIVTDATVYGTGTRPAYCKFTNVYFDSAGLNCGKFNNSVEFSFTNCWFSGGRTGGGSSGLSLLITDTFRFVNTEFINSGANGATVSAGAVRTVFDACTFESNSVTAGSGVAHGLAIAANTTDFVVQGCTARNGSLGNNQGWGVIVNAGTSDRYVITGNLLTGNVTGTVSDGGSGTNKWVDNAGTVSSLLTASAGVTTNIINSTATSSQTLFKNGGGNIMMRVGGSAADIQLNTDLVLPGGTWGAGNLINNTAPIFQNATFAGTTTSSTASFGAFLQQTDNSSVVNNGVGLSEHLILNGSGVVGVRAAGSFRLDINAITGNASPMQYVALGTQGNLNVTDATTGSSVFGFNPVASIGPGITANQCVGTEINTWIQAGATVRDRIGLQIVDVTGSTYGVQSTRDDVALSLNNQYVPSPTLGFKVGIEFGRSGGQFPVATNGTLIYGQANAGGAWSVAKGIDWSLGTATTSWLNLGGVFTVDGSGNTVVGGTMKLPLLTNAANDAAAAGAGVVVGQFYRNGSVVMQRVA